MNSHSNDMNEEIRTRLHAFEMEQFNSLYRENEEFREYAMKVYEHPKPTCAIFYEREAYVDKEIPSLRLTFDRNVRYRTDALDLRLGSFGKVILPENAVLLEIKTDGGMPLPLSKALDELSIYPTSFSKYGTAYTDLMKTKNTVIKGEFIYA